MYLPYSDWFGTANGRSPFAVPNQSRKTVNTIRFRVDLIRFGKDFPARVPWELAWRNCLGMRTHRNAFIFLAHKILSNTIVYFSFWSFNYIQTLNTQFFCSQSEKENCLHDHISFRFESRNQKRISMSRGARSRWSLCPAHKWRNCSAEVA